MRHSRRRVILLALVAFLCLAAIPAADLQREVNAIARPHRFGAARWMAAQLLLPRVGEPVPAGEAPLHYVLRYLALTEEAQRLERQRDLALASNPASAELLPELTQRLEQLEAQQHAMRPNVERILASQIRETLDELGLYGPADRWGRLPLRFPPLTFRIEEPPQLLVVSPRERIESVQQIMLQQDLAIETALRIEDEVEALGLSALVTPIGGFGATYPTFVAESASLRWTIDVATEEWFHQYLAFAPLGALYVLDLTGIRPDYEIARINETVAGLFAQEVTDLMLARHYGGNPTPRLPVGDGFDYTTFMRETRVAVDRLLADGRVEEAEAYMEERRQELVRRGFAIRKLNQAYFAFHGTYTYGPAAVDPIYEEVKLLRAQSATLRDFVLTAASLRSRDDLRRRLALPPPQQARERAAVGAG